MRKRLTYEFVKKQFEKEGYELLDKEYIDSKTKLKYKCPKGHEHSIIWSDWQQNRRCRICSMEKGAIKRRVSLEFIKSQFEKEGYELLSKKYINAHTKLRYRCPKGHNHNITWNNWQQGNRCPYCAGLSKLTIKFIRSEFEKEGYKLLTKKYINAHQKLDYICFNGHKHNITWASWQQGHRCFICDLNIRSLREKLDFEIVKKSFEKENYKLLTTEYKNAHQKLDYICPEGHRHSITWGHWCEGHRCPYCADNAKLTIKFIKTEFAKEGYKLLTEKYRNNAQKLEYVCLKGHKHSISWRGWQQGQRCPYCFGNVSKSETEVRNFIESLKIKVLPNDRNQIFNPETGRGLELDIFMPDFNKAVEYNGEYWHRDENKDLLKQELCKSKDIDLMTIWDKEWKTQKDVCKNKIKKFVFNNEEVFK